MDANLNDQRAAAVAGWQGREQYWRRRLGRIRLGVEPVDEQVAKYYRVTWMLTAISFFLALVFVGLFTAFRRPDVGAILAGVLVLPIVIVAWVDFGLLRLRVAHYKREWRQYHPDSDASPGRA